FFMYHPADHPVLHSFPTRRSSDLVWYMPVSANIALRELGIVLFLACVGLKAGARFVEILVHGDGLLWMACAALITVLPLLIVGRSEEHTSELQSLAYLVCRLLLEK